APLPGGLRMTRPCAGSKKIWAAQERGSVGFMARGSLLQLEDAVVVAIRYVQGARGVHVDAVRLVHLDLPRRPARAGRALFAGSGHGGHQAGLQVNGADAAVVQVGQVHPLAVRTKGHAIDAAERRLEGGPAVAAEALRAGAREGGDDAGFRVDLADTVVPG